MYADESRLVRPSDGAALNKRREVHIVIELAVCRSSRLTALCGEPFARADVEQVSDLGEMPCVACQLLSREPDWDVLRRLPEPLRLPMSQSGP